VFSIVSTVVIGSALALGACGKDKKASASEPPAAEPTKAAEAPAPAPAAPAAAPAAAPKADTTAAAAPAAEPAKADDKGKGW
jgi:hypothetical protein